MRGSFSCKPVVILQNKLTKPCHVMAKKLFSTKLSPVELRLVSLLSNFPYFLLFCFRLGVYFDFNNNIIFAEFVNCWVCIMPH